MVSELYYSLFLVALAVERGFELWLSRQNARLAQARGGVEYGRAHLRWMKLLHTSFFIAALAEVWLSSRPFVPAVGWPCAALALAAQGLRYWAIAALGQRWNVEVWVVPGEPAQVSGPYRFVRHPNYLAVVIEGIAVPMIHGAYLTAAVFSLANAWLLSVRIRCEEAALAEHASYGERLGDRPRFWPALRSAAGEARRS